MDDVEKQIERAVKAYCTKEYSHVTWAHLHMCEGGPTLASVMRDLLAGKFKEEPLPEIASPPWPSKPRVIESHRDGGCFYVASNESGWDCTGPDAKTKRAAIEAWNAVFGSKP